MPAAAWAPISRRQRSRRGTRSWRLADTQRRCRRRWERRTDLLPVKLDVTNRAHAEAAVRAAGRQSGDPAKLARALITIASQDPPPRRFVAGADAIATTEHKIADLRSQIDANRDLSMSLGFD